MAEQLFHASSQDGAPRLRFMKMVYVAGATASLGLAIGAVYWGVSIAKRDITKIPIIAARENPMRVAPENPGGVAAENLDLAVSSVAAFASDAPVDQVALAPVVDDLSPEDRPTPEMMAEIQAAQLAAEKQAALDMSDLANALTSGEAPLEKLPPEASEPSLVQGNIEDALRMALSDQAVPLGATDANLNTSLRPKARPAVLGQAVIQQASLRSGDPVAPAKPTAVKGSAMVQFGTFDTKEAAEQEWARLTQTMPAVISSRQPTIQESSSGGQPFFRLRAVGFQDLADARRFCSAVGTKTNCIPVPVR